MFVHHPTGTTAREIVGGRIVDFDEDGGSKVTVPHLLEHYRQAGYTLTDSAGTDAPEFDPSSGAYTVVCPVCDAQPGALCTTNDTPRAEAHKRRESLAGIETGDGE